MCLYGKTACEIHECQTWGKCSIFQAEIALLTLMPFPLRVQGSRRVVAPDGLLNVSQSAAASFNEHRCACWFELVTGVRLFKADRTFVYLLPVCPNVPLVSRCQHATGEREI